MNEHEVELARQTAGGDPIKERSMGYGASGIKFKLTAVTIACVLGTAATLTAITGGIVAYQNRLAQEARAQETARVLREALRGRREQLAARAQPIADDKDEFQAAYDFREVDLGQLDKVLRARLPEAQATSALVADLNGLPVTRIGADDLARCVALGEARAQNRAATSVERVGEGVSLVAAVPIRRYHSQIMGWLTVASPLDAGQLGQLKQAAAAEIILAAPSGAPDGDLRPIGGTTPLDRGYAGKAPPGEEVVRLAGLASGGDPLVASALPISAGGRLQAALIFAVSSREAGALLRRVLRSSLSLSLVTTLVGALAGLLLARRLSRPIVEMDRAFREIAASGDLSRRVVGSYKGEIGQLAQSFNRMESEIEQLHGRVAEAERRMRDELQMGSTVQQMLRPPTVGDGLRCRFAAHSQTCSETGGDWYTVLHSPEQLTSTVIIADVTGHGVPAALVTAILHGYLRAVRPRLLAVDETSWRSTVEPLLLDLNQALIDSTRRALMASLLLATFDHRTRVLRWVEAGHAGPLVARRVEGRAEFLSLRAGSSGNLGDSAEPRLTWSEAQLETGDVLVVYTDGLVESPSESGEAFGAKRLRRAITAVLDLDARHVADQILSDLRAFCGEQPPEDDITLVVGRVV